MATYKTTAETVARLVEDGAGPLAWVGFSPGSGFGNDRSLVQPVFEWLFFLPFSQFAAAGFLKDNNAAIASNSDVQKPDATTYNLMLSAAPVETYSFHPGQLWLRGYLSAGRNIAPFGASANATSRGLLTNPFVNPAHRYRNLIASYGPFLDVIMNRASAAVDAHAFIGDKVSLTQSLAWPRTINNNQTPQAVIEAYYAEVFFRFSILVSSGRAEVAFAKEAGIEASAFSALVAQSASQRASNTISGSGRASYTINFPRLSTGGGGGGGGGTEAYSLSIGSSEGQAFSYRASDSERRSFADRISTEPEADFQASPLLSRVAWGLLRPYFDLDRQRKLEQIIRSGGS